MIRKKKDLSPRNPMIIDLTGPDGNAFALLGYAKNFCKQLDSGNEIGLWDKVQSEMTSGDYENLLEVFDSYFGTFVILER